MHNRISSRVAVSVVSFIALAAFACSSAPTDLPSSGKDPKGGNTPAKAADDKEATPATPTGNTPGAPAEPLSDSGDCGKKATAEACGDCCLAKAPAGGEVGWTAFTACVCQAPGACKTECAESYCGGAAGEEKEPSAACITCLDTNGNGEACDTKADAACDADAGCKAIEACFTASCDALAEKEEAAAGGGANPKLLRAGRAARAASRRQ